MNETNKDAMGERGLLALAARLQRSRSAVTAPGLPLPQPPPASENRWPQQVDAAKATWDKLGEAELLRCEGVEHRLIQLVEQRYGISRARATREVKIFLQEQGT